MNTQELVETRLIDKPVLNWIGLAFRLVLGGMWTYAGALKIGNLEANLMSVEAYQLPFPTWLIQLVGYAQPPLELALGILLLLGLFTRLGAIATVAGMIVFIAGISWAWANGLNIDCGCFSAGGELPAFEEPKYMQDILRDTAFLLMAAFLIWRPQTPFAVDNWLFGYSKTD